KKILEEEIETLSRTLKTLRTEIQSLRDKLTALRSRCELLEEAKQNYEGFSQGVKSVLKEMERQNPTFQKCHGVLADLLEVTPGYERAIEELLGPMVQALVVEDEEAARQGIRYLAVKGFGRVSFIVRSCFKEKRPGEGNALEKVKIAPAHQAILSSLLGGAWIVEDVEKISFRDTDKTMVTPKGELYRRGVLTGGSPISESLGLIGRERKIAALRFEIAEAEKLLNASLDQEKRLEATQQEKACLLEQKTNTCHQSEVELSNQENLFETVLAEEKKIQEETALVVLELQEVKGELEEVRQKEKTLTECLHVLEEEDQAVQGELDRHQSLVGEKRSEREKTLIQIAEVKTALTSIANRYEDQKRSYALLETTLQDKRTAIASRDQQAQSSVQRVEELTEEIARLEEAKKRLLQESESVEGAWHEAEAGQKAKLTEELSLRDQTDLYDKQLTQIQRSLHDLEMKEQEVQYQIRAMEERLRLTYKVELTSVSEEGESLDVEAVRPEIEKLREKLDRMGPVNLVAIEEYEELKKRNEFLTRQKEDLEKAKQSLHEAIQKINKVTRELFLTTFHHIQTHFQEYFRLLFGGGDAKLLLLDEQDVLESGIEILACPPGKKLQSVSLLSGGERALTVIALLFAVFKEKPSPFCVLDEIDASLDESNVARFTSVLEEFVNASQFILVTHNKRTITMADVMYGITMEKTGVSKIVSVKFKEDEALENKAIPV
ncbi:AAA family ATPase, partial [candidate division TA06 bacterium]|nr:AAA family ATPase [candidate division TA06 bacterium]